MTTNAPLFRTLDQLTGQRSGVTAVLDAADKISREHDELDRLRSVVWLLQERQKCTETIDAEVAAVERELDRLRRDNTKLREQVDGLAEAYERLVEENAGLLCRIAELDGLQAELELTRARLITARDEVRSMHGLAVKS